MVMRIPVRVSAAYLCVAMIFLAGCAGHSKPSRFYVLSPAPVTGAEIQETAPAGRDIAIGISRISIPKYLRKPQIVTRTGSNELQLAEYDRWAGKVEEDIGRVIAENLSHMLATDRVLPSQSMEPVSPDYTIKIDISRFDGQLGGDIVFVGRWIVADGKGDRVYGVRTTHISEPARGATYADMVAAQSRILATFSLELAEFIKKLTEG